MPGQSSVSSWTSSPWTMVQMVSKLREEGVSTGERRRRLRIREERGSGRTAFLGNEALGRHREQQQYLRSAFLSVVRGDASQYRSSRR
jgi:hypothetical protein